MEKFGRFIDAIVDLSASRGSGNLQDDILIVVLIIIACIAAVFVIVSASRWLSGSGSGGGAVSLESELRRFDSFGGKLHKLEKELSDLRTEIYRNLTFIKERLGELETEITDGTTPQKILNRRGFDSAAVASRAEDFSLAEDSNPSPTQSGEPTEIPHSPDRPTVTRGSAAFATDLEKPLEKSRGSLWKKLSSIFQSVNDSQSPDISQLMERIEETLIGADLGVKTTERMLSELKTRLEGQALDSIGNLEVMNEVLRDSLESLFGSSRKGLLDDVVRHKPCVVLIVGVNGSGKTTTTAKLGKFYRDRGLDVLLVAADTFRAAAVAQLRSWAEKLGLEVFYGLESAKPSTVVFDAVEAAVRDKRELVLIDTAGRLHTRDNLMLELEGVVNILKKKVPTAPHEVLLVIDGTAGQNALKQAQDFHARVPLSGVIVTKLDGTSKGGIVAAIEAELQVPVCFVGVGEGEADLQIFDKSAFVAGMLQDGHASHHSGVHAKTRREKRTRMDLADEL